MRLLAAVWEVRGPAFIRDNTAYSPLGGVAVVSRGMASVCRFSGDYGKKGVNLSLREMSAPFAEAGKKRIMVSLFRVSAGLVNSVERSGTAIKQSSGESGLMLAY